MPVPGGPQRIIDERRPAATMRAMVPSGPVEMILPDNLVERLGSQTVSKRRVVRRFIGAGRGREA